MYGNGTENRFLRLGSLYFRVKYAELARRYPLVDSLIYVGKNLSDEDEEDT